MVKISLLMVVGQLGNKYLVLSALVEFQRLEEGVGVDV